MLRNVCIIAIVWLQPLWKKCRTVLHMHSRTCMCGALCDLRMAPHNNAQRIPSLKDKHICTPGSIKRHTRSALMAQLPLVQSC